MQSVHVYLSNMQIGCSFYKVFSSIFAQIWHRRRALAYPHVQLTIKKNEKHLQNINHTDARSKLHVDKCIKSDYNCNYRTGSLLSAFDYNRIATMSVIYVKARTNLIRIHVHINIFLSSSDLI